MENLELKHLAHYLAYDIKVKITRLNDGNKVSTLKLNSVVILDWERGNFKIKPILRPLSDLTKEIEVNGEKFNTLDEILGNCCLEPLDWVLEECSKGLQLERLFDLPFFVIQKLIQWHFDVFGLIDKGLAVDINTIK